MQVHIPAVSLSPTNSNASEFSKMSKMTPLADSGIPKAAAILPRRQTWLAGNKLSKMRLYYRDHLENRAQCFARGPSNHASNTLFESPILCKIESPIDSTNQVKNPSVPICLVAANRSDASE